MAHKCVHLSAGAAFQWWCAEVRHFNCFNELSSDESFICWDRTKEDVWVRRPPAFALRSHPLLRPREDNYQAFLPRITRDGIMMTGVRAAESVQRLKYMAKLNVGAKGITGTNTIYPIYDWKTRDVWLYLKDNSVRTPEIYQHMWQAGISKNQLRVSQFFSSDTASSLVRMNEYYPDLMERVIRREPNAYLAALYWDSEMFGRKTSKRKELEGETGKDYKALVKDMLFTRPEHYFTSPHKLTVARQYRKMVIKLDNHARPTDYRKIHEALIAGDPKMRTLRAIYQDISTAYAAYSKTFRYKKGGEAHA